MKAWIGGGALVALALGSSVAIAQPGDGNELMVQCQNALRGIDNEDYSHPLDTGVCLGTVNTVMNMATFYNPAVAKNIRICIPDNVSAGQAARIVVKFLQGHPEQLNEERSVLAWEALMSSYRCM